MIQQPGIEGGPPIYDAAELLETELAEALLASLLGLLAGRLKGQRDADPLNDDGTPVYVDEMSAGDAQEAGEFFYAVAAGELLFSGAGGKQ